jgi:hypothetical protein
MAEPDEQVARLETTIERIFDRLDRIDAQLTGLGTELQAVKTDVAYLRGWAETQPGCWTLLLLVLLPTSTVLFFGLASAAWALLRGSGALP